MAAWELSMTDIVSDLPLKCSECDAYLVRITQPNGDGWAFCTECGAFNDAKEVIENAAGLIRGTLTEEQILYIREQVRLARKKTS
jgi:hypothetical protein